MAKAAAAGFAAGRPGPVGLGRARLVASRAAKRSERVLDWGYYSIVSRAPTPLQRLVTSVNLSVYFLIYKPVEIAQHLFYGSWTNTKELTVRRFDQFRQWRDPSYVTRAEQKTLRENFEKAERENRKNANRYLWETRRAEMVDFYHENNSLANLSVAKASVITRVAVNKIFASASAISTMTPADRLAIIESAVSRYGEEGFREIFGSTPKEMHQRNHRSLRLHGADMDLAVVKAVMDANLDFSNSVLVDPTGTIPHGKVFTALVGLHLLRGAHGNGNLPNLVSESILKMNLDPKVFAHPDLFMEGVNIGLVSPMNVELGNGDVVNVGAARDYFDTTDGGWNKGLTVSSRAFQIWSKISGQVAKTAASQAPPTPTIVI